MQTHDSPADTGGDWAWQKSSFCTNSGCVELAAGPDADIAIRDSKDPSGPLLRFPAAQVSTLLKDIKSGRRVDSTFYHRATAAASLNFIASESSYRLLVFHYSDRGIVSPEEITRILSKCGSLQRFEISVPGYSSRGERLDTHVIYTVMP